MLSGAGAGGETGLSRCRLEDEVAVCDQRLAVGPFGQQGALRSICGMSEHKKRELSKTSIVPINSTILPRWTKTVLKKLIAAFFLILVIPIALLAGVITRVRHLLKMKPRLMWGTTPIIKTKYFSLAARRYGYDSKTIMHNVYVINNYADFDLVLDNLWPRERVRYLKAHLLFVWSLLRFDIFHFYFSGGLLKHTPLKFLECQLLHLAGKKVIVMPHGSDIAVMSEMTPIEWRDALLRDYPDKGDRDEVVRRQVHYFSRHADFVVDQGVQPGYRERVDLLMAHPMCIDLGSWKPVEPYSAADGIGDEVIVVHAPNHRNVKGTCFLLRAVKELQDEGWKIRLVLLERQPNAKVHEALSHADIAADQFIVGYGLFAIEAMSLGKPVLSNLSFHSRAMVEATSLKECPIVNTPPDRIKANLKLLAGDPTLREKLGREGRRYVEKHHSPDSIGSIFDRIYRKLWYGEALCLPDWCVDYVQLDPEIEEFRR